ncbi:MAG: hypothetical protein JJE52_12940 [Acidimicrobiia bacterium]|nr:hypothetical protein [Acidimicrobiia bacterium]
MEPDLEDAAQRVAKAVGHVVTDAATVAVGLGILGVNRLQVLRRQVADRIQRPPT